MVPSYIAENCCPTKVNTCPVTPVKPAVYPNGFEISPALQNLLIASVACGDGQLETLVRGNFDTIACIAGVESCVQPNLTLIRLQVGLTDYALDAARNLVDESQSRGGGEGESHFRGSSYRDAEAKKQSQGTSKFKSRGNSYNNFERTSESHESSLSTSRAQSDGYFRNDGTDRSHREQNSRTTSFDHTDVKGVGRGDGSSFYNSVRVSTASSRTAPNPTVQRPSPIPTVKIISILAIPLPGIKWISNLTLPTVFGGLGLPSCAPVNPNPDGPPTGCANIRPSIGQGFKSVWNGNATASIGIPIPLAPVSLNIGFNLNETLSEHYRQQMVCSRGRSTVEANSTSNLNYRQQDDQQSNGETHLLATGADVHIINRNGTSLRTSTSRLHAESTGRMDSCGESHSFSTRQAHGEAQNTGESTSRSEGHGESENKFINRSKTVATVRYFNQVFKQLRQLRDLLWQRLLDEESRVRANKSPVASCAPRRGLTGKPLFWYANAMRCPNCFNAGCRGCNASPSPISEFAFNGAL